MAQPPILNPVLPFIGSLNYVRPGLLIRIQGRVSPSSRCFAVNLQCGPSVNPRDDIALHFSPVFAPPPRVVRNSLENGRWGPEESHGAFFPFTVNQPFEIIILIDHDDFKIAVNGAHYAEFRHRMSIHKISHISIDGETTISRIEFEDNPLPSAPPLGNTEAPYPSASTGMPPYPTGQSGGGLPYPTGASASMPPYPPTSAPFPPSSSACPSGNVPYPPSGSAGPYPPSTGSMPMPGSAGPVPPGPYGAPSSPYPPQPTQGAYPNQAGYPTQPGQAYPSQGYPGQGGYPTQSGYPSQGGYPGQGGYPYPVKTGSGGLLAGLSGAAAALGAGSMLGAGSKYLSGGHKKSSPIPIGGMAAGLGAAALGAAVLSHKPMKKLKKLYKHKFKGPKFPKFKHKFHKFHGGFKHKGWSSSSSSD